ncbi:hypothetical protein Hamer_G012911 [Homarus americanus]|uniref:Uncharacterized protein n=1 Tax=Homarus americanus TaxID=6706 RepID=A0A8J5MXQ4_HOMAM|nr:hypothetical protein Hamer_G012911 [Homarus americanus]
MKGTQACLPASATFLSEEFLTKVAIHYKIQQESEEILVAKSFLARKKETGATPDMLSVYKLLDSDISNSESHLSSGIDYSCLQV